MQSPAAAVLSYMSVKSETPRQPARILVIEDDADTRAALVECLREEGYEVSCASDGAEALGVLKHGDRPDLILLDLMLPGMDGWDFRAVQKKDPALSAIPVIGVSAVGKLADAETIRKPVRVEALLEAVRKELGPASSKTGRAIAPGNKG